jgi:hypothetical protein
VSDHGAWSERRRLTPLLVIGVALLAFGAHRAMNLGDAAPREFDAEDGMAISQSVQRAAADAGGEVRRMHVVRSTLKVANQVLFFAGPGGPDEDVYVVEATGSFDVPDTLPGEAEPAKRMIVILSVADPTRILGTHIGDSGRGIEILGDPEPLGSRD